MFNRLKVQRFNNCFLDFEEIGVFAIKEIEALKG
jgi:hypothetical protein